MIYADYGPILGLLEGLRREGPGRWEARCPAHDDEHASLSVRVIHQDRLALRCHAARRCSLDDILRALSLRAGRPVLLADLFPEGSLCGLRSAGRLPLRSPPPVEILHAYDYRDVKGRLLFQSVRLRPRPGSGRDKDFKQRRPHPARPGEWVWDLEGVERVLYRLPQLARWRARRPSGWVVLVEGEKDADRAAADGVPATTAVGGAEKLHLTDLSPLSGARVAVVYDLDSVDPKRGVVPGFAHALQAVNLLWGRALEVRLVRLPLPEGTGADYSDWREALKGVSPEAVSRELAMMIRQSPAWAPWGPVLPGPEGPGRPDRSFAAHVAEQLDGLRHESPPFRLDREALEQLAASMKGFFQGEPAGRGARALWLAAQLQRAAEDLGWLD